MIGLVLWFNKVSGTGMIWCEDQGPLAFFGPENKLPEGVDGLGCGDRVVFSIDMRGDVRHVRDVFSVTREAASADPREILAGYNGNSDSRDSDVTCHLRVVA
jgi:cold shock CspA family protein